MKQIKKRLQILVLSLLMLLIFSASGTLTVRAEDSFNPGWFGVVLRMYGGEYNECYFDRDESPNPRLAFWWTRATHGLITEGGTYSYDAFMNMVYDNFVTCDNMEEFLTENSGGEDSFTYDADSMTLTLDPAGGGGGFSESLTEFQSDVTDGTGWIRCLWMEVTDPEEDPEGTLLEEAMITLSDGAIERFVPVYHMAAGKEYSGVQGNNVSLERPVVYDSEGSEVDTSSYNIKWYKVVWNQDGYDLVSANEFDSEFASDYNYVEVPADQSTYYCCEFWEQDAGGYWQKAPQIVSAPYGEIAQDYWARVINTDYHEDENASVISYLNMSYTCPAIGSAYGDLEITGESRYDVTPIIFGEDDQTYPADTAVTGDQDNLTVVLRVVPKDGYEMSLEPAPKGYISGQKLICYGTQEDYGFDPEKDQYPNACYFAFTGLKTEYGYSVEDGKATILEYRGKDASVDIPSELGGAPVTRLESGSFAYKPWITSVKIPDSVTIIGPTAFMRCGLKELTIPGSVKTLEYGAFMLNEDMEKLVLEDGVEVIENEAFNSCSSLRQVTLPDSLKTLRGLAFNKTAITSITIPGSIETIESMAFISCHNLKEIILKDGVKEIVSFAFADAPALESVVLPASITTIAPSAFTKCNVLKTVHYCGTEEEWNAVEKGEMIIETEAAYELVFHKYEDTITPATLTEDGLITSVCTICGEEAASTTISHPAAFKLSATSYTFNDKARKPVVTVTGADGKVIASSNYTVTYTANKNAGKAKATVRFDGRMYTGTKTLTFTINKAANPITAKGKSPAVKASAVKKKAQTITASNAFTVKKAQGKVTYKKASGNKNITVSSAGKITVKKGLKKGTYKIKVNVKAAGNSNYKAKTIKNVVVTVKVK